MSSKSSVLTGIVCGILGFGAGNFNAGRVDRNELDEQYRIGQENGFIKANREYEERLNSPTRYDLRYLIRSTQPEAGERLK